MQSVLIAGGAGFNGQNLVHAWRAARPDDRLIVVDAMTYDYDQESWWRDVTSGAYTACIDKDYGFRITV
jgi:dTDP-D-glucose 4,6-dehydratase